MRYIISIIIIIFVVTLAFSEDIENSIGKRIADKLINIGINPYIAIFIIAMLPIVELRLSIPVGFLLELNWVYIVIISIIGNMVPIFFILFLFEAVEKILRKIKIFDNLLNWIFKRTMAKSKAIEKYEELGLMIFVGIPLPLTGAWTGSLIAYIMKLSYFKSLLYIFLGVLIAAAIVTTFSLFVVIKSITLFWKIIIITAFIVAFVAIYILIEKLINNKDKNVTSLR